MSSRPPLLLFTSSAHCTIARANRCGAGLYRKSFHVVGAWAIAGPPASSALTAAATTPTTAHLTTRRFIVRPPSNDRASDAEGAAGVLAQDALHLGVGEPQAVRR